MEKRKTLSAVDTVVDSVNNTAAQWRERVNALLDSYLCALGISAAHTRSRWIKRVVDDLGMRAEQLASEDMLEEAVEHMRDLIEARVAMVCNYDRACQQREIAQVLVVLLNKKYADCLNLLFDCSEADVTAVDTAMIEKLRSAITASLPVPVPPPAPMAMPVQAIELRSIIPLRRLFRRPA
ncbi:MAG: hypothetical protein WBN96_07640 [Gammaproteobacteria bacterium]